MRAKLPKEYIHLQQTDVLILCLKKENSQPIFPAHFKSHTAAARVTFGSTLSNPGVSWMP